MTTDNKVFQQNLGMWKADARCPTYEQAIKGCVPEGVGGQSESQHRAQRTQEPRAECLAGWGARS